MDLLFICATWHGLAKLRLHTDDTLKIFDQTTEALGEAMRRFANDDSFQTRELPREALARARRATKGKKKNTLVTPVSPPGPSGIAYAPSASSSSSNVTSSASAPSTRRFKTLNLDTYKYHSLGDVASTIRRFGTTDSYSTEIVSLVSSTSLLHS